MVSIDLILLLLVALHEKSSLGVDVGSDCNSQFVHTKMIESIHTTMSKRLKDFITDGTSPLCIIVDSSTGLLKKTNNSQWKNGVRKNSVAERTLVA